MKKLIPFLLSLLFVGKVNAQYVTIPDSNFVHWLAANVPSAMSGNQLDTTNATVINFTSMDIENLGIADLTGVQYFDSLKVLDCGNGSGATTPNTLVSLSILPTRLETLICGNNLLTSLPSLPNTLITLDCYNNQITSLPTLPNSLVAITCTWNHLGGLPTLPVNLQVLSCGYNPIGTLPTLPNTITSIDCSENQLWSLPTLPTSLTYLNCGGNILSSLPALPNTLTGLYCGACNFLSSLPTLPTGLSGLACNSNPIDSLPALPNTLTYLNCYGCSLTSLPVLPDSLTNLVCYGNQLTSLPTLPNTLLNLNCSENNITCFAPFPTTLTSQGSFYISGNPFTCLPNYIAAMDAATLAYPLCEAGNASGCPSSQGIYGYVYKDNNSNCLKDAGDSSFKNIPLKIYDSGANLLGQTVSSLNGVYSFQQTAGTYNVLVDTTGMPFVVQCINPGLDSLVTVATIDTNINFAITCKPGFDVGVQSAIETGIVFPGQQHNLSIVAGDMSRWYNLNCASGVAGQVQVTVTGNVTYVGAAPGALTPLVSGNVFTYTVADFGLVNNSSDFSLLFSTDTTAQTGDVVCVNIAVTPTLGDSNTSNNNYQFCYPVINSHDPNKKEVYPVDVTPNYQDWFTYTIHFQNTGTAPAINIRLLDTLDANLDIKTFQVINYSAKNTSFVNGNVLSFSFPSINLPDSISDPNGSIAYVQYRIKPKANLPAGTQIKNTANIYFDYNPAVVTNTTINNFVSTTSINAPNAINTILIFPNPTTNNITITAKTELGVISVFNSLGEIVLQAQSKNKQEQIDVSKLNAGIYFIEMQTGTTLYKSKFIKE